MKLSLSRVSWVQLVRQELRQRETSLQLFAEEAQGLGALHPSMKEEVGRRVNLLSNKWDAVERAVDPDKDTRAAPTQAFQGRQCPRGYDSSSPANNGL